MEERRFILKSNIGLFDKQAFKESLDPNETYEEAIKNVYRYCLENATDHFIVWLVNETHNPNNPIKPFKAEAFAMADGLDLFDQQGVFLGRAKSPEVVYVEDGIIKHKEN